MSGLVNKVKDALHSDKSSSTTSQPEGTHGQHNSRVANAADPRIDSDRDHRAAHTTTTHGTTHGTAGGLHESSTAAYGTHEPGYASRGTHEGAYNNTIGDNNRGLSGPASTTDGPHKSNLMNKADPRVDSDRDYSRNMGANPDRNADLGRNTHTTTSGTTHSNTLGSTGPTHTSNTLGSTGPTHTSNTLGSTGPTHHTTTAGSGLHSSGAPEGTYGPHSGRVANAADPRVDSDRDHRGTSGHAFGSTNTTGRNVGLENTYASGPASNTAGPHKSDMLNKADPRVDSDLDGSKTYGGNKTYGA
jgi:hypothetical protein